MKISVDVECTPEEARRAMGLPDLTPVHDAYIDKMKRVIDDGVTPDNFQALIGNWMPMGEAGMNMWRTLLDQMGRAASGGK
jgi:hypothetical protein